MPEEPATQPDPKQQTGQKKSRKKNRRSTPIIQIKKSIHVVVIPIYGSFLRPA
jgi:hypothetical protein